MLKFKDEDSNETVQINLGKMGFIAVIIVLIFFVSFMFVKPYYNVWRAEMNGKAIVAEASSSRRVLVEQAKAEKEAAMERAAAIKIVGEAAQKYPEYRQQEFIGAFAESMKAGGINQIIYVPTEANIPIMESTRFMKNPDVK